MENKGVLQRVLSVLQRCWWAQWDVGWLGRSIEGWQLLIEQVPIHELEDWEGLLSMLRLVMLASLVMRSRQRFACPRRPFLSCLG